MSAKAVELILLRQLLSRLPLPATLVDADETVIYFNPATERLLGLDWETMGERPLSYLPEVVNPRQSDDSAMGVDDMPLAKALHERRPQQYRMIIHDSQGIRRRIVTTAIPLDGQGGTLLGALNFFWEENEAQEPVMP